MTTSSGRKVTEWERKREKALSIVATMFFMYRPMAANTLWSDQNSGPCILSVCSRAVYTLFFEPKDYFVAWILYSFNFCFHSLFTLFFYCDLLRLFHYYFFTIFYLSRSLGLTSVRVCLAWNIIITIESGSDLNIFVWSNSLTRCDW